MVAVVEQILLEIVQVDQAVEELVQLEMVDKVVAQDLLI